MNDAERWMEIAETMTLEAAFGVETNAAPIEQAEVTETAEQTEMIEAAPEPRTARVLSISQLRQKLGMEEVAPPVAKSAPPAPGRPRIVKRRGEAAAEEMELMVG